MAGNEIVEHGKLTFIGRFIIPWAIKYRNDLVLKYVSKFAATLLDIGGGKGYLARTAICKKSISIDEQGSFEIIKTASGKIKSLSDLPPIKITNKMDFRDEMFDYVTMIAVVEHLKNPEKIIQEAHRILKKDGLLIMTTPFPIVEKVLFFLDRGSDQLRGKSVEEEHENYFNLSSMNSLTQNLFKLQQYKKFQLGINQLFIYRKKKTLPCKILKERVDIREMSFR